MPLESNSAACVSPSLTFEAGNGSTFTFNFQMDGRVTIIGFQDGQAVTGALTLEQAQQLGESIAEYVKKRQS